jgi:hypothetical protein
MINVHNVILVIGVVIMGITRRRRRRMGVDRMIVVMEVGVTLHEVVEVVVVVLILEVVVVIVDHRIVAVHEVLMNKMNVRLILRLLLLHPQLLQHCHQHQDQCHKNREVFQNGLMLY